MTLLFLGDNMKKVLSIGELLIDFMPTTSGVGLKSVTTFEKAAGGAPANVVVAVSKMQGHGIFLGQVGQDPFGQFLIDELNQYGVDTSYVETTNQYHTGLAFVALTAQGERDFIFYRNPCADQFYQAKHLNLDVLNHNILHFCSVSLLGYPILETHKRLLEQAKIRKTIVSFDPNVRLALSNNHTEYQNTIQAFLTYADIIKISDDELKFITKTNDYDDQIQWLLTLNAQIIIITKGQKGVTLYHKGQPIDVIGYPANVVDTTGAGDAWIGSFLAQIANHDTLDSISTETLAQYANISNAFAAMTTESKGAMIAMPLKKDILEWIKKST